MAWRRARRFPTARAESPAGEWRDDTDQAWAEQPVVAANALGRKWRSVPLVNNAEQIDPLGTDPASNAVREARARRHLTALDDGQAWRRHLDGALVVARVEVFAEADHEDHRASWRGHAEASLDATWRERWRDRGVEPGWVEARWRHVDERPGPLHGFRDASPSPTVAAVDWVVVEDHTDPTGEGLVTCYQHLTVWQGRATTTLVARHELGAEFDELVADLAVAAAARPAP